jgi:hypothetical protein
MHPYLVYFLQPEKVSTFLFLMKFFKYDKNNYVQLFSLLFFVSRDIFFTFYKVKKKKIKKTKIWKEKFLYKFKLFLKLTFLIFATINSFFLILNKRSRHPDLPLIKFAIGIGLIGYLIFDGNYGISTMLFNVLRN